jgi:hypothetical protein
LWSPQIVTCQGLELPPRGLERTSKSVGHNEIDFAGGDVSQEALQRGSIHIAAGEAAIVVAVG